MDAPGECDHESGNVDRSRADRGDLAIRQQHRASLNRQAGILGAAGYESFIQVDAPINPGNSGGPLIDAHGNVIGVNAQIDSSTGGNNGVGFAIPIDTVKQVTHQLITSGSVQHAFLGVRIATQGGGVRIASVEPGSAAAKAGLKVGDVVLAVDGKTVASSDQLRAAIAAHKPSDKVSLRVKRSGSVRTVGVTLGTRS